MEQTNSFDTVRHALGERLELDESFEQIETPAGFKDIQLYPHQRTVVKYLLDLERKRCIKLAKHQYHSTTRDAVILSSSAIVLSEPFGSGKTFEILAMILLEPIPRAYPDHINNVILDFSNRRFRRDNSVATGFRHEIRRKFTGQNALIRPNLIVVGPAVILQWEQVIKTYTNLRVFVIANYHNVKVFQDIYKNGNVKAFDVILLKNGIISGDLMINGVKSDREQQSMIYAINQITINNIWPRVFYDDFDTVKTPSDSVIINSLSTIYVSATIKENQAYCKEKPISYKNVLDAISQRATTRITNVLYDRYLFSNFNVRNKKAYTDASTNVPRIDKYRCIYSNPDDNYIRLLGAMGEEDANQVMEMLNGDAIATAADLMGVTTNSVADIFQRMLDKKYDRYINDRYVLETIEKVRKIVAELDPHENEKFHSQAELDAIRGAIIKKNVPHDKLKYSSYTLDTMLDELTMEYKESFDQNGLAINRVIDNIKEGECQVCRMPLQDMDTFIVKCCGLIVCDFCGIKGNQINKKYDYKTKMDTLKGSCANCKADIYPQNDLIFVNRNLNIETLLQAKGDERPEGPVKPDVVMKEAPPEPDIKNPKLRALYDIICGRVPEDRHPITFHVKQMLEGSQDRPAPPDRIKKVLVFANFTETLYNIENFLKEKEIKYLRLGGKHTTINELVERFHKDESIAVLLINSQDHCAGLNLQRVATDLVFFHKILNPNTEGQVVGRLCRVGLPYNANVYWLCYKNEARMVE